MPREIQGHTEQSNGSYAPVPELWGGVECTINRTGDRYFSQMSKNGHLDHERDLELFADVGINKIRYPVLWEQVAPDGIEKADWSWPDARLAKLRDLMIEPIVGLLHHGSGPTYTDLLDLEFPEKFAAYAAAVAKRYPWVEYYTPINEPLTTARFSALYGHWYPHAQNDADFVRAFLNQCKAIVMAMKEIRKVNPAAKLVQTEDLGKTYATRALQYQANFENERRWATYDLLCGKIVPGSTMWEFFKWTGINEQEFQYFLMNRCPPDILGINHYVTSERFLDSRIKLYPKEQRGHNGRHHYIDTDAVRVGPDEIAGFYPLMKEAAERYSLPLAITEVHLGCTREEQMRWLHEAWEAANCLCSENTLVVGVTAWALLGSHDWNTLLTRETDHYEPGVFDLRSARPRITILKKMLKAYSLENKFDHPLLQTQGWWRRPERM